MKNWLLISQEIRYFLVSFVNHLNMDSKKPMIPALSIIIEDFQVSPIEHYHYRLAIEHKDYRSAKTFCEQKGTLMFLLRG